MSWAKLLAEKAVAPLPSTKQEPANLRTIVTRSPRDVLAPGLSADTRFVMAYDAVRTLSLMVVRAPGYRPRSTGAHYHAFAALEAADPRSQLFRRTSIAAVSSGMFRSTRLRRDHRH